MPALQPVAGRSPIGGRRLRRIAYRGSIERQAHRDDCLAAFDALNGDGAAVLLDDLARAGQADATTPDSPHHITGTPEAIEDARQVRLGNAHAVISYAEHGPVAFIPRFSPRGDLDLPAIRAVFHRVLEDVAQHALQTGAIPLAGQVSGRGYLQVMLRAGLLNLRRDQARQISEVSRLAMQLERLAELHARHVHEAIDHARHTRSGRVKATQ